MNNLYHFDEENHLHTLNGTPLTRTSSVIDVLAKPLTWWASGKAVEKLGWLNPKKSSEEERIKNAEPILGIIKGMETGDYLKLLDKAYSAHKDSLDKSAKKGTDLHAELEKYVKSEMGIWNHQIKDLDKRILPFVEWSKKNIDEFLFSEAHTYSERLWTGGIVDAGAKLKDGSVAIIDFKSSKEAYTGQFIQAGGYALEVEESGVFDNKGEKNKKIEPITKLIIVPFGADPVLPVVMSNVQAYKDGFESAVKLYRLIFNTKE